MESLKTIIEQPLHEHFIWYKKEKDRIKFLQEYTIRLGEFGEMERLMDENYRLMYTHYLVLLRMANKAHVYASKNENPKDKDYLNRLEKRILTNIEDVAKSLGELTNMAVAYRSLGI